MQMYVYPGGGRGHAPRHMGKRPECTKSRHFQTQNGKILWGGAMPASFPLQKSQHACFAA